jgi:hypothetical protein
MHQDTKVHGECFRSLFIFCVSLPAEAPRAGGLWLRGKILMSAGKTLGLW